MDAMEQWLAANAIEIRAYSARISRFACDTYQAGRYGEGGVLIKPVFCAGCPNAAEAPPEPKKKQRRMPAFVRRDPGIAAMVPPRKNGRPVGKKEEPPAAAAAKREEEAMAKKVATACGGGEGQGLRDLPAEAEAIAEEAPVSMTEATRLPGAVVLEFTGDDAEVINRFIEHSRAEGGDPAEDVPTILELFLDGDLVFQGRAARGGTGRSSRPSPRPSRSR